MQASNDTKLSSTRDDEPKAVLEALEHVSEADRMLVHFPILQDKSHEELELLNKAVLRKLDWYFLPCVTVMLLMSYLDRINISNARLAGMQEDLHMSDTTWSAGISLFYVGYIISQVPANVFNAKGKPSNIISNVFSGLLAAAILTNMDGIARLRSWQWFILLEGIVSVLVAVAAYRYLLNFPDNTSRRWFSEEEAAMAQYWQLVSAGGIHEGAEGQGDYWGGVILAAKDPFTWFFAAIHFSLIIAQSFKDFFPSIVETLGFSEVVTYLVQAPPYHCWHVIVPILVALGGAVLMISTLNVGARYFILVLLCTGPFVGLNIQISWEATVVPRPRTKRAALIAVANCVSSISHWFTPYFFLTSQEPRYQTGGGIIIAGCGLTAIFCLLARWWCVRKNKQLDEAEAATGNVTDWRYAT
ncbi:major facilitator superfamily domain-containing protein [Aspergillus tetrazonus]